MDKEKILDNLFDAVIVFSPNRKIAYANRLAKVLVKNPSLLKSIRDVSFAAKSVGEVTVPKKKKTFLVFKKRIRKKNGTHILAVIQDVSETKELAKKDGDFVSIAAHRLRTPLTSVIGYLAVFLKEARKLTGPQWKQLNRAYASSLKLATIIDNLVSTTHYERGFSKLNVEPFSVRTLIEEIAAGLQTSAKDKEVVLTVAKNHSAFIEGDREKIRSVFVNLINNAIIFNRPDGRVEITIKESEAQVVVSVTDTGIGIPEEAQKHIFEKFFRVGQALEKESQGTGLGLYVSKAIVELHGGKIYLKSKVGRGSTFTVVLPKRRVENNG